ncbi:MAG: hypothetical protein BM558_11075 [Roseobacter sp. MedPE-SW]|nr:MAG: hypothetical protein BM558_11075 [Roseobacter sp. MedPE-SW]
MKGFLGGVSIGALLAVGGAAMWSLSAPLPARVQVESTLPDQSDQPETTDTEPPETSERRDADLVEAAPSAPATSGEEDTSPIAVLDTDPGARPVVATAEGAGGGDVAPGRPLAALPQAPSAVSGETGGGEAPDAPDTDQSPVVSTETAELPAPQSVTDSNPELAADIAQPGAPTDASSEFSSAPQSSDDENVGTEEATSPEETAPATEAQTGSPAVPDLSGPQIGAAPTATVRPSISTTPAVTPRVVNTEAQAEAEIDEEEGTSGEEEAAVSEPESALSPSDQDQSASDQEETAGSRLSARVVPLTERSRTPTLIGSNAAPAAEVTSEEGAPFEINAEEFAAPDDRPLMSIVLIDDAVAIGAEALEGFPYPLTFAISPQDPKAAEKTQARRAAGFEVLMLADLPREATPQDAETAMAVWMQQMPQAVGILEGVETGFQGNRALADQMVAVMQATGYGMVTQNSGLNTVQKLALRDGMPSGVVFRDFDGAGQNPRAIRRFLDQAAFRARQEGAVIMLGRLRPDTISALLLWGLQDRASQVGLAPISAGLKANLASTQ